MGLNAARVADHLRAAGAARFLHRRHALHPARPDGAPHRPAALPRRGHLGRHRRAVRLGHPRHRPRPERPLPLRPSPPRKSRTRRAASRTSAPPTAPRCRPRPCSSRSAHPAVVSIIPGGARAEEVSRTSPRSQAAVPPALWSDLKRRA